MNNKVLIVAAHPDDEILWIWWTILKYIESWDFVFILILSNWEASRWNLSDDIKRQNQAKEVSKKLWVTKIFIENLHDNEFDSISPDFGYKIL